MSIVSRALFSWALAALFLFRTSALPVRSALLIVWSSAPPALLTFQPTPFLARFVTVLSATHRMARRAASLSAASDEAREGSLNLNPVRAENPGTIGGIGGFEGD